MEIFETMSRDLKSSRTELLQLALSRAGFDLSVSGVFDGATEASLRTFQENNGILQGYQPDKPGLFTAGAETWAALEMYLTGFTVHTAREDDTLVRVASRYGAEELAILTANPGLRQKGLLVGQKITIPLSFDVVPDNIRLSSAALAYFVRGLKARYPFLHVRSAGTSVMGRRLHLLEMGSGTNRVFFNAAHHANEWITSLVVLKYLEEYAKNYDNCKKMLDFDAKMLYNRTAVSFMPMVNPDGVDLVTAALTDGEYYRQAKQLSENNPDVPFPSGWKANISGVDLNLQYPAGWENAQIAKAALGIIRPGPRDYVGPGPLTEPESRAVYTLTQAEDFSLTLSFHTQGKVIYWKYLDFEPINAYEAAQKFAAVSGYAAEETPLASGYAGYKDWFISAFGKPGFTIEAGEGVSPLPLEQLPKIYAECSRIMTHAIAL